jgi:hypothetical protein
VTELVSFSTQAVTNRSPVSFTVASLAPGKDPADDTKQELEGYMSRLVKQSERAKALFSNLSSGVWQAITT